MTASEDNTARLWDVATGKQIGEPLQHEDTVTSAVFSSDGTRIVTTSDDNTARLWDVSFGVALKLDGLAKIACERYLGGSALAKPDELLLVGMEGEGASDVCAE